MDKKPQTMELQRTIARSVDLMGRGLFLGESAKITFRPAPANHGVVFSRRDLGGLQIPALIEHVTPRARRTALQCGPASVETCEHCLSAVAALNIDNLLIEIEGPELPGLDGSSKPFVDVLQSAGITDCDQPRRPLVITHPVVVQDKDATILAVPSDQPGLQVIYDLDYPDSVIGRQTRSFDLVDDDYIREIAPARTYVLESEAQELHAKGIGTHLTPNEVLVIGKDGPLGTNKWRFPDEAVRHKIVDLIGDLSLLGAPIHGKIVAFKSGHTLNHQLIRELIKQHRHQLRREAATTKTVADIRKLTRILPHRYPMLLVDRILKVEGDRRILGIKNVTINEPFFQGHYPSTPIMPGVLIVEAMAQLSGVLIGQSLEHTGKLAVLLSLDRVKLRRPVTPGDQLMLEAEAIRIRTRIAHMRCKAYVGEELAAEAEIKFMLVDDEQD